MTEETIPTNGTSAEDVAYAKKVKEIYIDGVNVAGCEHLTEIKGCWLSTCDYLPYKGNITNQLCKYNDNCYYKQLKRLEQENKELKEKIKDKPLQCLLYNDKQNKCALFTKTVAYRSALEEIREVLKDWDNHVYNPQDLVKRIDEVLQ